MKFLRPFFLILLLLPLSGCAALKNFFGPKTPKPPVVNLQENITLEQILTMLNRNSMLIRNMTTEDATLRIPEVPFPLRTSMTFERPKRLRIRGSVSALSGQEFDFGSNDMLFWLWARKAEPKEIYYCRHDQFATSPVRHTIPIEPDWILEALGIVEFRPDEHHEGPFPIEGNQLMVITRRQTASGQFTKKTTIDAKTTCILRQEMYSPQNVLIAQSISSDHRHDKATGVLYAKRIEVQCQGSQGTLTIDLGNPTFNSLTPIPIGLFTMPTFDGYRPVDLANY